MSSNSPHHRSDLRDVARQAMIDRDLWPDFSAEVQRETAAIGGAAPPDQGARDLRALLWCSIDNDDSLDLDQLSVSEKLADGSVRIQIAIADVDAVVGKDSAIDQHARHNTTSVYTAAEIFSMLPERLSTDLTSLAAGAERLAVVVDFIVDTEGNVSTPAIYRAQVRNQAKLAYNGVGAWLEGAGPLPPAAAAVAGMEDQLKTQDAVAQKLRRLRAEQGALELETIEPRAVFEGDTVVDLRTERPNRARQLIEDFMVAANGVTARFLEGKRYASLRRVVRSPERWQRIVAVAKEHGESLPPEPDSKALADFLIRRRKADPIRFADLSLVIIKLMGRGEYIVERPGDTATGHFGLAVRDYTHSTAPNRRFPDLLTQRLLKAALTESATPYGDGDLQALAAHCTEKEDDADKVERQVRKSAAALLLEQRIGEHFDGIVTGISEKGTWVRVLRPPVEGKLVHGFEGLAVGQRIRVKLVRTDFERGFIDFVKSG